MGGVDVPISPSTFSRCSLILVFRKAFYGLLCFGLRLFSLSAPRRMTLFLKNLGKPLDLANLFVPIIFMLTIIFQVMLFDCAMASILRCVLLLLVMLLLVSSSGLASYLGDGVCLRLCCGREGRL